MKKCNCTVIYRYVEKHYEILKIMVKHKHENISLYAASEQYTLFDEMYFAVLAILKANNFYVHTWKMFEGTWYDIDFIDVDNWKINRYSYGGITSVQR